MVVLRSMEKPLLSVGSLANSSTKKQSNEPFRYRENYCLRKDLNLTFLFFKVTLGLFLTVHLQLQTTVNALSLRIIAKKAEDFFSIGKIGKMGLKMKATLYKISYYRFACDMPINLYFAVFSATIAQKPEIFFIYFSIYCLLQVLWQGIMRTQPQRC